MGDMADYYGDRDFADGLEEEFAEERHAESCGGKLMRRVNGKTGVPFYGCAKFPKCRYSQPDLDYEDEQIGY